MSKEFAFSALHKHIINTDMKAFKTFNEYSETSKIDMQPSIFDEGCDECEEENKSIRGSIIKCPSCGAEYLPAEIFLPDEFFGRPEAFKGMSGKIEDVDGIPMNQDAEYQCDYCGKKFKVHAEISFCSTPDARFDDEYVTDVYPNRAGCLKED